MGSCLCKTSTPEVGTSNAEQHRDELELVVTNEEVDIEDSVESTKRHQKYKLFEEYRDIREEDIDIHIDRYPSDPWNPQAQIIGPKGTPYEDGEFNLSIHIPSEYPSQAPEISFLTKIYHPNIDKNGKFSMEMWRKQRNKKLADYLSDIRLLLISPDKNYIFNPEAHKLYFSDTKKFNKITREWVLKHAFNGKTPTYPQIVAVEYKHVHRHIDV